MRGTIVKLPEGKSFGFLQDELISGNTSAGHPARLERFFEAGQCVSFTDLEVGDFVSFDPQEHARGERAVNVRLFAVDGDLEPSEQGDPHGKEES